MGVWLRPEDQVVFETYSLGAVASSRRPVSLRDVIPWRGGFVLKTAWSSRRISRNTLNAIHLSPQDYISEKFPANPPLIQLLVSGIGWRTARAHAVIVLSFQSSTVSSVVSWLRPLPFMNPVYEIRKKHQVTHHLLGPGLP